MAYLIKVADPPGALQLENLLGVIARDDRSKCEIERGVGSMTMRTAAKPHQG